MNDIKLTNNFKLSEFVKTDVNYFQLAIVKILATNLQKVRDMLQQYAVAGKNVSINVTSGIRTEEDYTRLKNKGYNPSKTSDHFTGYQLQALPTLGAADIQVKNCTLKTKEITAKIIDMVNIGLADFGQVIYEKNPATGTEWIHLGNDPKQIFSVEIASEIYKNRARFLMSLDNGKTYVQFK